MSPAELGRRVGMSEGEATTFLATLIREGRVRMHLVEAGGPLTGDREARVDESIQRVHAALTA